MKPIVPSSQLDPDLFQTHEHSTPTLYPYAKTQIMSGLARIQSITSTNFMILYGPSLTSPEKTLPVYVLIGLKPKRVNDINVMSLNILLKGLNDNMLGSTQHPLKFFLTMDEYDLSRFDQAYAPLDDKWLKYVMNERNDGPAGANSAIKSAIDRKEFSGRTSSSGSVRADLYKPNFDDMTVGKKAFLNAHTAEQGLWNITIGQAKDILEHFNTTLPKRPEPFKMLGNTGIMVYRPAKDKFLLLKGESFVNKAHKAIEKDKFRSAQ